MQKGKILVLAAAAFMQSSCLSTLLGSGDTKSRDYHFPEPGKGWEPIDPAEADAAYRNSADQSILNVSSTCGEDRFRSLEDLSEDVFRQLPERQVVEASKPATVDGHPALITEVKGKVDGNDIQVRLAVVRTQHCLYDIMLAGPQLDETSRVAFDRAVKGFHDGRAQ